MTEHKGLITFKGNPLTLLGDQVAVGQQAPAFTVLGNDLAPVTLADFKGKTLLISAVPSLDTPVCDIETRRFNEEAAKLGPNVAVLTVSMDLPFAQKRWCGAHGITAVKTASDHREASFGLAYGVLIKELRLLTRTIFIVDKAGKIAYVQRVGEVTHEPDYADVLKALAKVSAS
ncbi:MAG: thiol peroxidase [Planctomycetota bacterium]|nr:thiol peroxidase [Planctomycetota bacterium]